MSVQYGDIFGSFSKLAFEALICSQVHLQCQFREHDKKTGLGGRALGFDGQKSLKIKAIFWIYALLNSKSMRIKAILKEVGTQRLSMGII